MDPVNPSQFIQVENTDSDLYEYEDITPLTPLTFEHNSSLYEVGPEKSGLLLNRTDQLSIELKCVNRSSQSNNEGVGDAGNADMNINECLDKSRINCKEIREIEEDSYSRIRRHHQHGFFWTSNAETENANQSPPRKPVQGTAAQAAREGTAHPSFIQCPVCCEKFATYAANFRRIYEKHRRSHDTANDDSKIDNLSQANSSRKIAHPTTRRRFVALRRRHRVTIPDTIEASPQAVQNSNSNCLGGGGGMASVANLANDEADITTILSCPYCTKTFIDLASRGRHIRLSHRSQSQAGSQPGSQGITDPGASATHL